MKYKTIKTAAMAFLALGLVSCADELNIKSIDKKYSTTYTVEELLAKQYGSLGLTGQKGATGDGDVTDKEDESGFYRTVFNLQELNSDEILWAWLENTDMSPICFFAWNKTLNVLTGATSVWLTTSRCITSLSANRMAKLMPT